jgi:hypothetical protein
LEEKLDKKMRKQLKELGEIAVEVHRVKIGDATGNNSGRELKGGIGSLPEKALKGRAISRKTT